MNCIRIDGGTPPAMRQALVSEFQQKDSIMAAVVHFSFGQNIQQFLNISFKWKLKWQLITKILVVIY